MEKRSATYLAIDLKSFYASVECVERGLDPLTTNLVVADAERTDKTICLAVSPSLKSYGVPSRPRLFEVVQRVREVNSQRRWSSPSRRLVGESFDHLILKQDPTVGVGYITAKPRMALYIEYSTRIYNLYLKYFAPEDIHVYSIDEVFIDITGYTRAYKLRAYDLAMRVVLDVFNTTGITATAGIGTNMYLAKVAMDIVAKRMSPTKEGVRIASLDETGYRKTLWSHKPLTDFWRIGRGYDEKLRTLGVYTMGDVALLSLKNEGLLYKLFGVNAELLIDHAWGYESCGMRDIKSYRPMSKSLSSGQVLSHPYPFDRARIILCEMCDRLVLDMVAGKVAAGGIVLDISYDAESLRGNESYRGEVGIDHYGRLVPKHSHGSVSFERHTSSTEEIMRCARELFDRTVDKTLLVRRINISAVNLIAEEERERARGALQMDIFTDAAEFERGEKEREILYSKEKRRQNAIISLKSKFGKNALVLGMSFEEGATMIDRNLEIGGHKA